MHISSIEIDEWRQFKDVHIDFHPRLTVLTGPNGSGKSTLLSLVSMHLSYNEKDQFLATPINDLKTGATSFSLSTLFKKYFLFRKDMPAASDDVKNIGAIKFSNGEKSQYIVREPKSLKYDVEQTNDIKINGFKIDSHRAAPVYQEVTYIPVSGIKPEEAFRDFSNASFKYKKGQWEQRNGKGAVHNPLASLKDALIGFAAFGADNAHMKAVSELVGLFEGFQEVLRHVLPEEIGFEKLEVRSPEIVIISKTGQFPVDSASGGIMSIIQTAWQIFLFTKAYNGEAVVLIDEPENHLHPSLQRDFLGALVRTFSNVQFIVATHSPFVITSVKESKVYALQYIPLKNKNNEAAIRAQEIDFASKARTADKILDKVLGVSVTLPVWAERDLKEIAEKFEKSELSERSIVELKRELELAGLSEFFPEALGKIAHD